VKGTADGQGAHRPGPRRAIGDPGRRDLGGGQDQCETRVGQVQARAARRAGCGPDFRAGQECSGPDGRPAAVRPRVSRRCAAPFGRSPNPEGHFPGPGCRLGAQPGLSRESAVGRVCKMLRWRPTESTLETTAGEISAWEGTRSSFTPGGRGNPSTTTLKTSRHVPSRLAADRHGGDVARGRGGRRRPSFAGNIVLPCHTT